MPEELDQMYDNAVKLINSGRVKQGIAQVTVVANQGHIASQRGLAIMYNLGQFGVAHDYDRAFYWFSKAAQGGCAISAFNLAGLYYFGRGTERDLDKAFYWYSRSAEKGFELGEYNLAILYSKGEGTEV